MQIPQKCSALSPNCGKGHRKQRIPGDSRGFQGIFFWCLKYLFFDPRGNIFFWCLKYVFFWPLTGPLTRFQCIPFVSDVKNGCYLMLFVIFKRCLQLCCHVSTGRRATIEMPLRRSRRWISAFLSRSCNLEPGPPTRIWRTVQVCINVRIGQNCGRWWWFH